MGQFFLNFSSGALDIVKIEKGSKNSKESNKEEDGEKLIARAPLIDSASEGTK